MQARMTIEIKKAIIVAGPKNLNDNIKKLGSHSTYQHEAKGKR